MRPVTVPASVVEAIRVHARSAYPDECCGFLVALPDPASEDGPRRIVVARPAANEYEGERRRRFLLRPDELRAAEGALAGSDRSIAGFYHSHPDHPAQPSRFDQEHAWPWYTYVVVGVSAQAVGEVRAFELDPESSEFHEVPLTVGAAPPDVDPMSTR